MNSQKSACIDARCCELPALEPFWVVKEDEFDFAEFWNWEDKDLDAMKVAAGRAGIIISRFSADVEYSLIDTTQQIFYLNFLKWSIVVVKKLRVGCIAMRSNGLGEKQSPAALC